MKTIPDAQRYQDRTEAGRLLAVKVREHLEVGNAVILALARGGVPVGSAMARELDAPLEVLVVRKLGVPTHPEFAMGAIASGGCEVLDLSLIDRMGISRLHVAAIADRALSELRRRESLYRTDEPPLDLRGRTVLLVDDGMATGASMRAAIHATRDRGAGRLVVAVPVGDPEACERVGREVDVVVCPFRPDPFYAVSLWYRDFRPTTDEEVRRHLAATAGEQRQV